MPLKSRKVNVRKIEIFQGMTVGGILFGSCSEVFLPPWILDTNQLQQSKS